MPQNTYSAVHFIHARRFYGGFTFRAYAALDVAIGRETWEAGRCPQRPFLLHPSVASQPAACA